MIIRPSLIQEKNNDIPLYSGLFEMSPTVLREAIFWTPYSDGNKSSLSGFWQQNISFQKAFEKYLSHRILISSYCPIVVANAWKKAIACTQLYKPQKQIHVKLQKVSKSEVFCFSLILTWVELFMLCQIYDGNKLGMVFLWLYFQK